MDSNAIFHVCIDVFDLSDSQLLHNISSDSKLLAITNTSVMNYKLAVYLLWPLALITLSSYFCEIYATMNIRLSEWKMLIF